MASWYWRWTESQSEVERGRGGDRLPHSRGPEKERDSRVRGGKESSVPALCSWASPPGPDTAGDRRRTPCPVPKTHVVPLRRSCTGRRRFPRGCSSCRTGTDRAPGPSTQRLSTGGHKRVLLKCSRSRAGSS